MCRNKLVGVTSFGINCGKFPGVYARISNFVEWIRKNEEKPSVGIYSREEFLPKENEEKIENVVQKSIGNYLSITLLNMTLLYFIIRIF